MLCPKASLDPLRHHAQLLPLLIVQPARRTRLLESGGFTAANIAQATSSGAASSLIYRVTGRPRGFGALFGLGLLMTRLVSAFRVYHGIHGSPPLAAGARSVAGLGDLWQFFRDRRPETYGDLTEI